MDRTALLRLLGDVQAGALAPEAAADALRNTLPQAVAARPTDASSEGASSEGVLITDGHAPAVAHLDHHRALRCGFPEVLLGSSKTADDLVQLASDVLAEGDTLLVTRVDGAKAERLCAAIPDATYHQRARALTVLRAPPTSRRQGVLIVTAGTGDVPVAEEARVTAWAMGEAPEVRYDLGVAGLHRILGEVERLQRARVVVVAAGMDGALPSVVGGLVGVPVIAVPTSVGYGLNLGGLAPLLTMMNACAPGVSVVNIDNGFGAGYLASLISSGGARSGTVRP